MISAVIITKNEELNIGRCLKAIIDWVDEIIILDSKSEDKTRSVIDSLKSEKIKFFEVEWEGYAKTKNRGLNLAKGDWLLSIDADEVITEGLAKEILETVKNSEKDGYSIPRLFMFCGKKIRFGGSFPNYQLRLFKKGMGYFEDVPVHEGVVLHGKKGFLKNFMLHFSYYSLFDYWRKFNIYTELEAAKMYNRGERVALIKMFTCFWVLFERLILKLGFLDGIYGIFYHVFSSINVFVRYAKLWELQQRKKARSDK